MGLQMLNDVVYAPRREHKTRSETSLLRLILDTRTNRHLGTWTAAVQIDFVVPPFLDQFRRLQQSVFVASSKLGNNGVFALLESEQSCKTTTEHFSRFSTLGAWSNISSTNISVYSVVRFVMRRTRYRWYLVS